MSFSVHALIQRLQSLQMYGITEISSTRFKEMQSLVKQLSDPELNRPHENSVSSLTSSEYATSGNQAPENIQASQETRPSKTFSSEYPPPDAPTSSFPFLRDSAKMKNKKTESEKELPVISAEKPDKTLEKLILMEDREEALRLLGAKVARCTKCLELVANRTQTVLGVGNPYAELMFIGEAPGADEDRQGIPFVGRAGKLLTEMIEKGMKISRLQQTYVCNILRCRPPGNRTPLPKEAEKCRVFLDTQISIVRPKYICCLGASAAQNLLQTTTTISRMRGKIHTYRDIPVICTYHPAYLLRNPSQKKAAWEDLLFLMKTMGITHE
ncbi:MAG: uracil-DNA glycosylase [Planctomycetia bacterium]|nr:uracil-DNA glycosylase [Planctomycetia bacterium]